MQQTKLLVSSQPPQYDNSAVSLALPNSAATRFGRGYVHNIDFFPEGDLFAVGTRIGLWLYKLPTMSPIGLWETKRGLVSSVAFSPNGRFLATSNWDGDVNVWDIQHINAWRQINKFQIDSQISQVVFSPNGQYLAVSGEDGIVYIWQLETCKRIARFSGKTEDKPSRRFPSVVCLCFSPDNNLLSHVEPDGTISVWDVKNKKRIACFIKQTSPVYSVSFSPCGRFITSGSRDGVLNVWDVTKGERVTEYNDYTNHQIYPSYSPDGILRAAEICEDTVVIWDVFRNEKLDIFEYRGTIITARFSNGEQLAISTPIELKVWSAEDASTSSILQEHTSSPASVAFSPDGQTLAAGYWKSNGIILWDIARKRARRTFADGQSTLIRSLDFSPCGNMLVAGSHDTSIRVWDVKKSRLIIELTGHQKPVRAVRFTSKGHLLVSADTAGNLYVWDVQRWKKLKELIGHKNCINSMALGPDGKLLASASEDRSARLWDIETGREIAALPMRPVLDVGKYKGEMPVIQQTVKSINSLFGVNESPLNKRIDAIAFSPQGDLIAGGLYREIRLWDVPSCEIRMIILQSQGCHYPFALTFSPCGHYLASGAWWQGTDKVPIQLWDVASGENIVTFWGHPTDVQSLAFSPDGALLASGSYDGTILLWDMTPYL